MAWLARMTESLGGMFHDFRSIRSDTASISAMANANVPLEIRQKLTGHASEDMNKHYTHLELETVRRAAESISRLPARASDGSQHRSR
jgi:hypothetical protein